VTRHSQQIRVKFLSDSLAGCATEVPVPECLLMLRQHMLCMEITQVHLVQAHICMDQGMWCSAHCCPHLSLKAPILLPPCTTQARTHTHTHQVGVRITQEMVNASCKTTFPDSDTRVTVILV
jgi:hypothetical protein